MKKRHHRGHPNHQAKRVDKRAVKAWADLHRPSPKKPERKA